MSMVPERTIKLNMDQVIQALADYLYENEMIDEFETNGTMVYELNNDASVTIKLRFESPTMN
jgi:ribosomal protein S17E|tara:strand:- start:118 stop:303 length:186 start_codon:yes stop_codon:yes gene_type:complete